MIDLLITGFIEIRFLDVLDIVLAAILLYLLYNLLKGTVAINIFFGIMAIFLIWKIVDALQMELLSQLLGAFFSVGFIAMIIIFQPEIRQFLLALGKPGFISKRKKKFLWWKIQDTGLAKVDISKIIQACQRMGQNKQGALIVMTRRHELLNIAETGEQVNADVSIDILENIFFPNSPLHDGAVIITGKKIVAARCVLPVSKSDKISSAMGLRHRAAVGVTEQSDAIAIVVSEQTGKISYAIEGMLSRNVQPAELHNFLEEEFQIKQ